LTAVLEVLLNADAARFSGCEFLPAVAVAAPVAGKLSVPRRSEERRVGKE
jgi:hypothetical protein